MNQNKATMASYEIFRRPPGGLPSGLGRGTTGKERLTTRRLARCAAFALMLCGTADAGAVAPNEVCIYEHVDYVGASRCFRLEPWMRHKLVPSLGAGMNDRASSLLVGKDVLVLLYEHANFGGTTYPFDANYPRFSDRMNDRVSSLIVRRSSSKKNVGGSLVWVGDGVILQGSGGQKMFYPLPERLDEREARFPSLGPMNDKAVRIGLFWDLDAILYEHANFSGKPLKLPGAGDTQNKDWFDLPSYQFGGRASSLVVRARGDLPAIQLKSQALPPPPRSDEPLGGEPHRAPPAPVTITPKTMTVIQPGGGLQMNTNRPGQDYRNFDLPSPDPKACQAACMEDEKCRAWTYIKPGVQEPSARCWLKSGIPPAESAPCCVSGVK